MIDATAQAQANWWFFGENAGLDFTSGTPVAITGSVDTKEGTSVISDAAGNLLFYSDGQQAYDKNHNVMPNGDNLEGHWSATQSALIVQKPGSATEYYLFTVQGAGLNYTYDGTAYSVVDMTLNGGLGDIVPGQKNIPILSYTDEKLVAVRHANGCDVWILMHKWQSDAFYAYLLTNTGLSSTPVITNIGSVYNQNPYGFLGYLQPNPQGTQLAAAIHADDAPIELFDFDNSTGVLSNFQPLPITGGSAYGVCFSPDGTKLYAGYYNIDVFTGGYDVLVQWDLTAANIPASQVEIFTSQYDYIGALQRGPDGKIYVTSYETYALDVINNPNAAGLACDYQFEAVDLLPFTKAQGGLPNIFVSELTSDSVAISVSNCQAPYTLTATTGFASYLWSTGETTQTITAPADGSYWVEATGSSCYAGTVYDSVILVGIATPQLLGGDTSVCDSALILTANGGWSNYFWSTGETGQTVQVTQSGAYWVSISDPVSGCFIADTIDVFMGSSPGLLLGPDVTVCENELPLTLTPGNNFDSYAWQDGSTDSTFTATAAGTFWVSVESGGCASSDTVTITTVAVPSVDLGDDIDTCTNGFVTLEATGGAAPFLWNTGETTQTIQANASGTYWVQSGGANCFASDSVDVLMSSALALDLGPDTVLCEGQSLVLQANVPGAVYTWQDGSTNPSFTVETSGVYALTVSSGSCSAVDSINIGFVSTPIIDLGNDTTLCVGDTVYLDAGSQTGSLQWNNGSTSQTIEVFETGVYSVTAIDAGCPAVDSISVTMLGAGALSLGGDQTICLGDVLTLDASVTNASYLWSTGDTTQSVVVTESGLYAVTVTTGNCTATDSAIVSTVPAAEVNLGSDTVLCLGHSLELNAGQHPNAVISWSTGDTSQSIVVTHPVAFVVVQVAEGNCIASDTIYVADTICTGDDIVCLFVPNAFSPNDDGFNDEFLIIHCGITEYELRIYNRWGENVFTTNDPDHGWDGLYKREPAPLSVYAYYLRGVINGEHVSRKGNITLLR